jgi:FtsH-binding integral membrane protein
MRDNTVVRSSEYSLTKTGFMNRVYAWMTVGLLLTGVVAFVVSNSPTLIQVLFSSKIIVFGLVGVQLVAVIGLSAMINRLSVVTAGMIFLAYAALTGLTFAMVFLAYTQQSIASAFIVTTASFAGLSAYGFATKRDLGPIGSFCIMGLFGLVAVSILSFFFHSLMANSIQMAMSVAGVIIFAGLTAYDTQRIKQLGMSRPDASQEAVLGALMLYLDFINLFLMILRLMGDRR